MRNAVAAGVLWCAGMCPCGYMVPSGIHPGHDRNSGWGANRAGVGGSELHSLGCQGFHVWGDAQLIRLVR